MPVIRGDAPKEAPKIGSSVKRGMTWTVANTAIAKGLSFLSIAMLGLLLSPTDFGLYGISFSIAAFVQIFRDGGVVQLLVQRGEAEYAALRGPVFWMALAFNAGTGVVLSVLAPLIALLFHQPRLLPLLIVIGLAMPLGTPGVVLQARLAMQLRFGAIARIQLISSVIRYGGTIVLAWAGLGPLSFVLPLPAIAIYESLAAYSLTREAPWRDSARTGRWRELFVQSRWLIFMALAAASLNQGTFLALGAVVDEAVVGVFFFAYQFVMQIDAVLAATAGAVLFPALSRLAGEPERFRAALLRSSRLLMFLAAPATMALLVGFGPLEDILWHNRWDAAVWPVQVLSLFYAARVFFSLPSTALMAQGHFRTNAMIVLFCGVGMMLATTLGALVDPAPGSIAVWLGAYIGAGCIGFAMYTAHLVGVTNAAVVRAIMPVWVAAWLAGSAAVGVDLLVRPLLEVHSSAELNWLAHGGSTYPFRLGTTGPDGTSAAIIHAISQVIKAIGTITGVIRLVLVGAVLCIVFGGLLRVTFPRRLREGMHLAPARFHHLLDRALFLRHS